MSSQSDPVQQIKTWAIQSISLAISLRAEATGKPVGPKFFTWANREAEATALDFWNETFAEAGPNVPAHVTMMKVAQKVFDWCHSHMNPEK